MEAQSYLVTGTPQSDSMAGGRQIEITWPGTREGPQLQKDPETMLAYFMFQCHFTQVEHRIPNEKKKNVFSLWDGHQVTCVTSAEPN